MRTDGLSTLLFGACIVTEYQYMYVMWCKTSGMRTAVLNGIATDYHHKYIRALEVEATRLVAMVIFDEFWKCFIVINILSDGRFTFRSSLWAIMSQSFSKVFSYQKNL